jgi:RimJ/RimL family protein N-acetyltransferase
MTSTDDTPTAEVPTPVFLRIPGSDGLYFRPIDQSDVPAITAWVNDPETQMYHDRYVPTQTSEELEWVNGLSKRKDTNQVLMIVNNTGTQVGTMGLHQISYKNRHAFTGAMFGNEAQRNKGIGYRAKMVLLAHAFYTLGLETIGSHVLSFNRRSQAYSEKCGYVKVGRLHSWIRHHRETFDQVTLQVNFENWLPRWEQFRAEYQVDDFPSLLLKHGQGPRT